MRCSSCRKLNEDNARYCNYCGSIIRPIFCSRCGTANPEGLEICTECGNRLPSMTGIRWGPSVKVVRPTGAMNERMNADESQG